MENVGNILGGQPPEEPLTYVEQQELKRLRTRIWCAVCGVYHAIPKSSEPKPEGSGEAQQQRELQKLSVKR